MRALVTVAFFSLAIIPLAYAWVPPTFYIVQQIARKHHGIEGTLFRHRISIYKKGGELLHTLEETLVLTDSDHATIHLIDDSGAEIASKTRKLFGSKAGDIDRPVPYDLLLIRNESSVFEHFKALGLPIKSDSELYSQKEKNLPYKPESDTTRFERLENRYAVQIGDLQAKPSAAAKTTQLWVEKDSYLPLRAIFPTPPEPGVASEPLEFRFSSYNGGAARRSIIYPNVMQVYRDGVLWVKVEAQEIGTTAAEPARSKAEPSADLKEFIEMYFKWVK